MDKRAYPYSESRLADHIGIARSELKFVRDQRLDKGRDWEKNSGEIVLNGRALAKVCRALQMPASELDLRCCLFVSPAKKEAAPHALTHPSVPISMLVYRIPLNQLVLTARKKEGPLDLCQVIVGDNRNFTLGMEFRAIPAPAQPGFYLLSGPRPRQKGRW